MDFRRAPLFGNGSAASSGRIRDGLSACILAPTFSAAREVALSFSSLPARLTDTFVSRSSIFGMRAPSHWEIRVLSASLTDQVPKPAANPRAASPNSAAWRIATEILARLQFRTIGTSPHLRIFATGIEDQDTPWIGTKCPLRGAILCS